METLLQGIPGVVVYIDILITGATEEKHLKSLEEVLCRLDQAGLRAKKKVSIYGSFCGLPGLQN